MSVPPSHPSAPHSVPCRVFQATAMATLYPSLEDLKVDQAMQVTCQAVSLGALMGLWDYPRVAKGGWSWVKAGGPGSSLLAPRHAGPQCRGCWQSRCSEATAVGPHQVGKTSSCRQACVWCLLSPSASSTGVCADPMLWASFQVNPVAVVLGLLSPQKPFPPSILHEVLGGFEN